MTLLVIQLVRTVLFVNTMGQQSSGPAPLALNYVLIIGEMSNVTIRSVHFYFFCFTENFYLARASYQQ